MANYAIFTYNTVLYLAKVSDVFKSPFTGFEKIHIEEIIEEAGTYKETVSPPVNISIYTNNIQLFKIDDDASIDDVKLIFELSRR